MWTDVRYSLRVLGKSRGFTALAVAVLAVGIGINTALFSIAYAVFFRPLPVHAPEELVYLYWIGGTFRDPRPALPGYRDFEYFRDHPDAFSAMTAHWSWNTSMQAGDAAENVSGEVVFANYFDILGVKPILGRTFQAADDDVTNTETSVVISHALWAKQFQGRPDVVGTRVRLSDQTTRDATIIGVMPAGFSGVSDPWTPSQCWITFAQRFGDHYRRLALAPIARLKPGVSLRQAQAIVAAQGQQMNEARSGREKDRYLVFAANGVRMPFWPSNSIAPRRLTVAMSVVVGIVLIVTVANIAGLLLARGVTRSGELAVRLVLGATGRRIARQLLTEGLLLTVVAGVSGLLIAQWLIDLFRLYTPGRFAVSVWLDVHSWIFTAALSVVLGVLIGLAPAVQSATLNLLSALPGLGGGQRRNVRGRLRYGVVIPQIALSLVLLLIAAMHVRALLAIERIDLGYDTHDRAVLNAGLRPLPGDDMFRGQQEEKHAQRARAFFRQLWPRVQAVTGPAGVTIASRLPVEHPAQGKSNYVALSHEAFLPGQTTAPGTETIAVSPNYFAVLGMSLYRGRDFDERDTERTPKTAIVSESIARQLWPGRDPLGQSVAAVSAYGGPQRRIEWLDVVGVVNDVTPILQEHGTTPYVYLPMAQQWSPPAYVVIARVGDNAGSAATTVSQLKAAVSGADTFATVHRVRSLDQIAAEILYPRRLAASILGASAVIALLLASVGLYGVVSYSVAQRVHEIGVRAALGADRADILRLIIREGLKVGVLAAGVGLALSYTAVRLTSNLFVAMPRMDPVTLIAVPLVLLATVLLASYIPARRAATVDPMEALRAL
jgi:putative ABC transport system permease protein